MLVQRFVIRAVVRTAIRRRLDVAGLKHMLVDMVAVNVMQVSIVQVIRVRIMLDCGMTAILAVHVVVAAIVCLMYRVHHPLPSAHVRPRAIWRS